MEKLELTLATNLTSFFWSLVFIFLKIRWLWVRVACITRLIISFKKLLLSEFILGVKPTFIVLISPGISIPNSAKIRLPTLLAIVLKLFKFYYAEQSKSVTKLNRWWHRCCRITVIKKKTILNAFKTPLNPPNLFLILSTNARAVAANWRAFFRALAAIRRAFFRALAAIRRAFFRALAAIRRAFFRALAACAWAFNQRLCAWAFNQRACCSARLRASAAAWLTQFFAFFHKRRFLSWERASCSFAVAKFVATVLNRVENLIKH